jgi:hemerythrin-like domain-containing protein
MLLVNLQKSILAPGGHNMPRVDLFTTVHKALRALIYHLGSMLQTADFADEERAKDAIAELKHLMEMLHEHAMYEDNTVFAAARKFDAAMIDTLEAEHGELGQRQAAVDAAVNRVETAASAEERIAAGDELNRTVNEFIAFYLEHLMHEERTILPATWKFFSDEELLGMRVAVQKSTSPGRFEEWMRWMFPAININELNGIFRGLAAHAPRPFFETMSQIARVSLGEVRWRKVQEKAGLTSGASQQAAG